MFFILGSRNSAVILTSVEGVSLRISLNLIVFRKRMCIIVKCELENTISTALITDQCKEVRFSEIIKIHLDISINSGKWTSRHSNILWILYAYWYVKICVDFTNSPAFSNRRESRQTIQNTTSMLLSNLPNRSKVSLFIIHTDNKGKIVRTLEFL